MKMQVLKSSYLALNLPSFGKNHYTVIGKRNEIRLELNILYEQWSKKHILIR